MLAPCRLKDTDLIAMIRSAGYEMFDFEVPTEAPNAGFIKRF